tara:strand:- start:263 stop:2788 length:2526 start_codon:yes stop_codon:yes gene_type:complete
MNWKWIFNMATRDGRQSLPRLFLFTSSIIIGIAALVSISSFKDSLNEKISNEAKELLGADFRARKYSKYNEKDLAPFYALALDSAKERSFVSMAGFKNGTSSRLVSVKAIEGNFPFYGAIVTEPSDAANNYQKLGGVIADQTLFFQFGLSIGDSIRLGTKKFELVGQITKVSGQAGIRSAFAPIVYVPYNALEQTDLIQPGSRVLNITYLKINNTEKLLKTIEAEEKVITDLGFRIETVADRKKSVGRSFDNLTSFMNLVGFIALILGAIGVGSAVYTYVRSKIREVGVLRSLGASRNEVFTVFLVQIIFISIIGSFIGALIGALFQYFLPSLLQDFLPVSVDFTFQPFAIITGVFIGLSISILFALIPLLQVRNTSPMVTLNSFLDDPSKKIENSVFIVGILILLFLGGFAFWQTDSLMASVLFIGGLILAITLLWGVSSLLRAFAKNIVKRFSSFTIRQGIANLYRPNNFSTILITVTGLGVVLINMIFLIESNILNQLSFTQNNEQPNTILFDIQPEQINAVQVFVKEKGYPVLQQVPIVAMRLHSLKGQSGFEIKQDSTLNIPSHVVDREYRVTYRDTLIKSEKIIDGIWVGEVSSITAIIPVSLSENQAKNMKVEIGDVFSFNVSGSLLNCTLASIREVDYTKIQTNFTVLFPNGVLESAPQNYVLISRVNSREESAVFQNQMVNQFPNISVIDLDQVLKTANDVLGKISFVISFLAMLCLITGFLVLISAINNTKYERVNEGVLLKTLGAVRSKIVVINTVEYFLIGLFAVLAGAIISVGCAWAISVFALKIHFTIAFLPLLSISSLVILMITLFGYFNALHISKKPSLSILRVS